MAKNKQPTTTKDVLEKLKKTEDKAKELKKKVKDMQTKEILSAVETWRNSFPVPIKLEDVPAKLLEMAEINKPTAKPVVEDNNAE